METGLYAMRRQAAARVAPRFDFERGTPVRVYLKGQVFPTGSQKGQPLYFDGTINECVPSGVVIRGVFLSRTMDGHKKSFPAGQTICRRLHTEDIDRVEVRTETAGAT